MTETGKVSAASTLTGPRRQEASLEIMEETPCVKFAAPPCAQTENKG